MDRTAVRNVIRMLAMFAVLALLAGAGGALLVYFGVYNVAATEQHTRPVFWLLDVSMRQSIRRRAADLSVPPLDDSAQIERGLQLYNGLCVRCHGAPGVAPEAIGLAMLPHPSPLAHTAREWPASELFWVTKHGVKMSGMPAWKYRLNDGEIWAIVAFLKRLPHLTAEQYAAAANRLTDTDIMARVDAPAHSAADARRGSEALIQYACVTCHSIPGVVGSQSPVGPSLEKMASRAFIAGVLPNTPENMVRWLRDPPGVAPQTLMPNLAVAERDARDIAAYLYTLK